MILAATRSTPIAGCTAGENLAVDPTDFPAIWPPEIRGSVKAGTRERGVTNMRVVLEGVLGLAIAIGMGAPLAVADESAKVSVTLKDHKFSPAELTAPAGKPVVIELENQDKTPAEFESKALRVEKVVPGGGKITVQVRVLAPGRYRFFDDYHESTTEGFIVVK
jgi:plastocyanin